MGSDFLRSRVGLLRREEFRRHAADELVTLDLGRHTGRGALAWQCWRHQEIEPPQRLHSRGAFSVRQLAAGLERGGELGDVDRTAQSPTVAPRKSPNTSAAALAWSASKRCLDSHLVPVGPKP